MIKHTSKSFSQATLPAERNEQGSVLVYALIVITFLSGLAAYLQTMSDPKIFQTKDTQQILSTEYLADSMENILSELCEKDTDFSGSAAATDGQKLLAKAINKYSTIHLFKTDTIFIGEATRDGLIKESEISTDDWVVFSTNANYYIQYYNSPRIKKSIAISSSMASK